MPRKSHSLGILEGTESINWSFRAQRKGVEQAAVCRADARFFASLRMTSLSSQTVVRKSSMKSVLPHLPESFRLSSAVLLGSLLLVLITARAALAAPITGTVMNMTTGKASAGDTVTLIRLQQGMQDAGRTTTDARGRYTLNITDADPMHLVRVTHDKANYFKPAPPGTQTVNIDVYNSAEKLQGVSTEAQVVRIEAEGQQLHITENFFVKNVSSPPRTQFGPRAYEIYLPQGAQNVAGAALGPGSMPVQSSPVPLGPPGDYSFIFPIRPGETRFQLSYRMQYSGNLQLRAHVGSPVDNFAIILPKSMQFTSVPAAAFQSIDEDVNVQTFLSKNVTPKSALAFRIAGTGKLPAETAPNQNDQNAAQPNAGPEAGTNPDAAAAAQAAAANSTRPGIGLGVPIDTPDPLHKYMWWIISLVVILLAIGAGVSMKQQNAAPATATVAAPGSIPLRAAGSPVSLSSAQAAASSKTASGGGLLETLKEEMFTLETERLEGRIAPEEYERQKAALEIVLKRALDRRTRDKSQTQV